MKKIDLHLHTFYSDGEDSPQKLFGRIRALKVSLFSICDHNYISHEVIKIENIARAKGIIFFQGVEVSCIDRTTGESLHILGYAQSFDLKKLNKVLQPIVDGYNERARRIIEKLNNDYSGLDLDFNELRIKKKEIYMSRNTIANELIKFLGKDRITMQEALKEAYVKEDDSWLPNSKEVINIIRDAGGVGVLAHPGWTIKRLGHRFESLLKRLAEYGIVGVESLHSNYDKHTRAHLNNLAKQLNLIMTAGSDWHGETYTPDRVIGISIENSGYEKILEMVQKPSRPLTLSGIGR